MKLFRLLSCFLILIPLQLGVSPVNAEPSPPIITIAFIDVGQGDATLIQDGKGFDVLIDGGQKFMGEELLDIIRQHDVDDIEVILATHADSDHIGGLITVIQANDIPVESVYYNGYAGDTLVWTEFSEAVISEGLSLIPAQYPQIFMWGGLNVQVLNPLPGMVNPLQNEASVVVLINYEHISLLLPADIDNGVEALLPMRTSNLKADILKVAHHGSKNSTFQSFLEQVQPKEAIISVGSNPYGHPSSQVLARLVNYGAHIWRTDLFGTIQVHTDGETYLMLPRLSYLPLSFAQ
ncbi:ComEC/Rec2 family competence protein [Chloroflexota bacterium]